MKFFSEICDARERGEYLVGGSCAASHAANINNNANEDCVAHTQIESEYTMEG